MEELDFQILREFLPINDHKFFLDFERANMVEDILSLFLFNMVEDAASWLISRALLKLTLDCLMSSM